MMLGALAGSAAGAVGLLAAVVALRGRRADAGTTALLVAVVEVRRERATAGR
jgi:hypothetical protein